MHVIYVAMYSAMHILLFGLICDPDHLCFGRTTYNNINGPGGPFMLVIIGPAGPFMYPDQISRYRSVMALQFENGNLFLPLRRPFRG